MSLFLQQVYLDNLSGHLFVTSRDFQITLYFQDGKLVNGMSTRFDEKISVILYLMGIINEEQYNFLSGLHQFLDDQVIQIIFDHNFAKKKDIYYARIYQLRRIAISLFSLQHGKWTFTAGKPEPPLRETYEIPLAGILVEGARAIDHASFYSSLWLLHVPVLFKEIPLANEIYFTDQERDFYASVLQQGAHSCQELIARLNIFPIKFWRSMLAFHLLGIIKFEKSGGVSDISRDIAALLELNQKMQAAVVDYPGLLGLPSGASIADIEKVRAEYLDRFSPERFGSAAAPEIKKVAAAVSQYVRTIVPLRDVKSAQKTETLLKASMIPKPPPSREQSENLHQKSWDLYLNAKEFHKQQEFSKAVSALKQAIKLDPAQGDFFYLLGLSQSESEIMKNDAEINLKKAIELKPWSADPVYALGILYRSQDKLKIAERCFQRVKEIAHEHTGASRALVDLRRLRSGKKSKFSFLKK